MGDARERTDSEGHEKIQCRLCNMWYHRVEVHISGVHKINVKEYLNKFPGAPIMSERAKVTAVKGKRAAPEKPMARVDDDEADVVAAAGPRTFQFGVASLAERADDSLTAEDRAFIPIHDEQWEPGPTDDVHLEELALAMQDNENVLIVGPPGVGKTTLARELAVCIGQPLRRLPFNGEMRLSDLVGSKVLTNDIATGQAVTAWVNGPLPDAAERGHWVLADEFDSAPSHVTFVLHPVLEEHRQLTIMGRDSGHEIAFHDQFRFIATANTLGYGDDSGLYAGTAPMNEALLDRFSTVIRMGYPEPGAEVKILTSKAPGIRTSWASTMVDVATKVREAQKNQQTMVSLSPRRLIAWARKTVRFNDPRRAAKVTLLNKLMDDDAKFISGIVQRCFGGAV